MTSIIGRAGSSLNMRLGQVPDIKDPNLNYEMQLIYNSLHLLDQYMAVLRENLESAPGQNPSESVRFRRKLWGVAGQAITVGAVVSAHNNTIVNGVATNQPLPVVEDPAVTIGSTGSRRRYNMIPAQFFIALTAANPGDLVQVGVGPGIIQVTGAKCGQLVWAVAAISVDSYRSANTSTQFTTPGTPVNNGGLYLNNILGTRTLAGGIIYNWEGYWLPGFPVNPGGNSRYSRAYLYPVGVCVSDGYVMFSDYKRSDPLPDNIIAP